MCLKGDKVEVSHVRKYFNCTCFIVIPRLFITKLYVIMTVLKIVLKINTVLCKTVLEIAQDKIVAHCTEANRIENVITSRKKPRS